MKLYLEVSRTDKFRMWIFNPDTLQEYFVGTTKLEYLPTVYSSEEDYLEEDNDCILELHVDKFTYTDVINAIPPEVFL